MIDVLVKPQDEGKKLHRYIRQLLPGVPLSGIYKMLRTGRVKVNGKRGKSEQVVQAGDVIHLYMAEEDFARASKPARKFGGVSRDVEIIHEDESLIVVNKPVGLLVHGAGNEQKDTLVNRVLAYLYDRDPTAYQVFAPAPVNRLDRNTSGLVIFGKTNAVTAELAQQIAAHHVSKWYLAIVRGVLPERGEINVPLSRTDRGNRTLAVDPDASRRAAASVGKASLTRYERKATTGRTSVAKVDLVSGRTHQIRAHFERIGHPLWGDVKYGGRVSDRDGTDQHQWLHAAWMELPDGRRFHAPLPADFTAVLRRLGYTAKDLQQIETF